MKTALQTLIVGLLIPVFLRFLNVNDVESVSVFTFVLLWFSLLLIISHISKQMDRVNFLLKVVNNCLEEFE